MKELTERLLTHPHPEGPTSVEILARRRPGWRRPASAIRAGFQFRTPHARIHLHPLQRRTADYIAAWSSWRLPGEGGWRGILLTLGAFRPDERFLYVWVAGGSSEEGGYSTGMFSS